MIAPNDWANKKPPATPATTSTRDELTGTGEAFLPVRNGFLHIDAQECLKFKHEEAPAKIIRVTFRGKDKLADTKESTDHKRILRQIADGLPPMLTAQIAANETLNINIQQTPIASALPIIHNECEKATAPSKGTGISGV